LTPKSIHPDFIKYFVLFCGVESVLKLTEQEKKELQTWHKHHPRTQIFFQLLIEELLRLEKQPIFILNGFTGKKMKLKIILLHFVGDRRR